MKRFFAIVVVAARATLGSWTSPAHAAPPTVTPSPGYDARLQEQRRAADMYRPEPSVAKPLPRRRLKRAH
jgi:hypothetical protein